MYISIAKLLHRYSWNAERIHSITPPVLHLLVSKQRYYVGDLNWVESLEVYYFFCLLFHLRIWCNASEVLLEVQIWMV